MAHVPRFNALLEDFGLLIECHGPPFNQRNGGASANPNAPCRSVFIYPDILHVIVFKPAPAGEVLPTIPRMRGVAVKASGPSLAAQPDDA